MKRFMKNDLRFKIVMFFSYLIAHISLLITPAYAACNAGEAETDFGCLASEPGQFASTIYSWGLGLIGGLALLFIVYGSFLVLSSQGDPVRLQNGKSYIVYSLIGLALALGGYAFYRIIAGNIIKIPGFN